MLSPRKAVAQAAVTQHSCGLSAPPDARQVGRKVVGGAEARRRLRRHEPARERRQQLPGLRRLPSACARACPSMCFLQGSRFIRAASAAAWPAAPARRLHWALRRWRSTHRSCPSKESMFSLSGTCSRPRRLSHICYMSHSQDTSRQRFASIPAPSFLAGTWALAR